MQQNVQADTLKAPRRRWMKSIVAASAEGLPSLPWQHKRQSNQPALYRGTEAPKTSVQRAMAAR